MFRTVGFIVGCSASAGLLLLLMGTPDFHLGDPAPDASRYDRAIDKLREKRRQDADSVAPETADATPDELTDRANEDPIDGDPPAATAVAAESVATSTPPTEMAQAANALDEQGSPAAAEAAPPEPAWHAFWNPFRSEVAATGFVRRLENVTGLDYRIAKVKSGVYEVAFAYQTDDERSANLAQISAATGLDLSETLP